MRRTNEQSISKIIDDIIKENKLSDGITQAKINAIWVELMPRAIISRTDKLRFQESKLTIYLTSSIMRNELNYQKEELKKQFNDQLGAELITILEIR